MVANSGDTATSKSRDEKKEARTNSKGPVLFEERLLIGGLDREVGERKEDRKRA